MTTILTKEARLGDTVLEGQVLVLDIDGVQIGAPSKKLPWFKLKIDAVLPDEGLPNSSDVRWLMPGRGKLKQLFVVACFEPDTIAMPTADAPTLPPGLTPEQHDRVSRIHSARVQRVAVDALEDGA